jgi:hypothetical protein
MDVVLGGVDAARLLENLGRDLVVAAQRLVRGIRGELAAIDSDNPDRHQPGIRAKREHLTEQIGQGGFMADPKTRDRRLIGHLVRRDHPETVVAGTCRFGMKSA